MIGVDATEFDIQVFEKIRPNTNRRLKCYTPLGMNSAKDEIKNAAMLEVALIFKYQQLELLRCESITTSVFLYHRRRNQFPRKKTRNFVRGQRTVRLERIKGWPFRIISKFRFSGPAADCVRPDPVTYCIYFPRNQQRKHIVPGAFLFGTIGLSCRGNRPENKSLPPTCFQTICRFSLSTAH